MRNMSFMLTTDQIRNRTKTVTRRMGWRFLKPGALIQAIEKGQGLKKGEKVNRLAVLRVEAVTVDPLNSITPQDVYREGFPQMTREEFIKMFKRTHKGCRVATPVTRIQFSYVDPIEVTETEDQPLSEASPSVPSEA